MWQFISPCSDIVLLLISLYNELRVQAEQQNDTSGGQKDTQPAYPFSSAQKSKKKNYFNSGK